MLPHILCPPSYWELFNSMELTFNKYLLCTIYKHTYLYFKIYLIGFIKFWEWLKDNVLPCSAVRVSDFHSLTFCVWQRHVGEVVSCLTQHHSAEVCTMPKSPLGEASHSVLHKSPYLLLKPLTFHVCCWETCQGPCFPWLLPDILISIHLNYIFSAK